MKTSDLTDAALNWAVARCEGKNITLMRNDDGSLFPQPVWADGLWQLNYSTDWAQGGPIIERGRISTEWSSLWDSWTARDLRNAAFSFTGPTPLIAAMRCYVASKLGDEVDVPDELL